MIFDCASTIAGVVLAVLQSVPSALEPEPPALPRAWDVQVHLVSESPEGTRERRASYTLALAKDQFLINLGSVRVYGERSGEHAQLLAWHTHDPTTYFKVTGADLATLVRRELPAIWSSPLARWINEDANAYPLVGHAWPEQPVVLRDDETGARFETTEAIEVHTFKDAYWPTSLGVGISESIVTTQSLGQSTLNIDYVLIEPSPPESWVIDTTQRQQVSTIRALRAKPAQVQPGELVTNLRLFDLTRSQVDLRQAFAPELTPRGERRADALLLVFERSDALRKVEQPGNSIPDQIAKAREQLAVNAATDGRLRPLLVVRPVEVFHNTEFDIQALDAFEAEWVALNTDALLDDVERSLSRVLWTHPSRDTIDLFTPGAQRAAVLIDRNGRLRNALRLDEHDAHIADWLVLEMTIRLEVGSEP